MQKRRIGDFKLNRRSSKRLNFFLKTKFGIDDTVFPAKSCNVSQHGMLIHSFKAFLPKTSLIVKIFTSSETIILNAVVKWVKQTSDNSGTFMGLKFVGNNFEIRKLYLKELNLSDNNILDSQVSTNY